jgi:hypothetical protein
MRTVVERIYARATVLEHLLQSLVDALHVTLFEIPARNPGLVGDHYQAQPRRL